MKYMRMEEKERREKEMRETTIQENAIQENAVQVDEIQADGMPTDTTDTPDDDGKKRCAWATNVCELYREYHDKEWGVPVHDDQKLFEMLVLESFQAGLSWLIVLKKREYFREVLDGFDAEKIASYGSDKLEELMADKRIIRNRAKLSATVTNAAVFLDIQKEFGSFSDYLWGFTDNKVIVTRENMPTKTPLSDKIAADLKRRGMRFMGSVTVYSFLQAVGVLDDHEAGCYRARATDL